MKVTGKDQVQVVWWTVSAVLFLAALGFAIR